MVYVDFIELGNSNMEVILQCKDGNIPISMETLQLIAQFSTLFSNLIDDISNIEKEPIEIPCSVDVMDTIIQYCHQHSDDMDTNDIITRQKEYFIQNGEIEDDRDKQLSLNIGGTIHNPRHEFLNALLQTSNYLDIQGLLHVIFQTYAKHIKQIIAESDSNQEAASTIKQYYQLHD